MPSLVACLASAATGTAPVPTASPTTAATEEPAPWILIVSETPTRIRDAITSSADSRGLATHLESLAGQTQIAPPGLRLVVGNEKEILAFHDAWANAGIGFVVLDPVSLEADESTSVVGAALRFDQAGFLAGVAAGLATSAGSVGLTPGTGEGAETFAAGFDEGLRYTCPKCRQEQVSEPARPPFGVDVVAISPNSDPIAGVPKEGAPWLIVIGEADLGEWADRAAARVRPAPETVVKSALAHLLDGDVGQEWNYAVEDGGLQVDILLPEAISPGRERLLREAESLLASGFLVVGGGE